MTSQNYVVSKPEWHLLAAHRLSTPETIRLIQGAVELGEQFDVNIRDRAFEISEYLLRGATPQTLEEQLDEMYQELRELARTGDESTYQDRLKGLLALEREQARRYEKQFDQWRPLQRKEFEQHLADARRLLRK